MVMGLYGTPHPTLFNNGARHGNKHQHERTDRVTQASVCIVHTLVRKLFWGGVVPQAVIFLVLYVAFSIWSFGTGLKYFVEALI